MLLQARKSKTFFVTDLLAIPEALWNFSSVVSGSMAASALRSNPGCKLCLYWLADI